MRMERFQNYRIGIDGNGRVLEVIDGLVELVHCQRGEAEAIVNLCAQ